MIKNDSTTKTFENGIKYMEEKMLSACESGRCFEIRGRAYYVISDKSHLRMIFDDIEKKNSN